MQSQRETKYCVRDRAAEGGAELIGEDRSSGWRRLLLKIIGWDFEARTESEYKAGLEG